MEKKAAFNRTLCLNFCAYYKPGKKEDLACRGHQLVEQLMHQGKSIRFTRSGSVCDPAMTEAIAAKVCSVCDFRVDGCDFTVNRKAPACGGFILLAQLIAEGIITFSDI